MESEKRTYRLPTETLPGLDFSHHYNDLIEFRNFLTGRGVQTTNTRIDRYISYLQQVCSQSPNDIDASKIFKNSVDGPFQHSTDWLLYVLREVHELGWILKGLKIFLPKGIDEKLNFIVSGRDFAALDGDSRSRDIQFELRIASYFCQTGCEVHLSEETDVIALTAKQAFYIECKRVGNENQLPKRLSEARKQLSTRMPRKNSLRIAFGCVAADVTKVAFSHNGLTHAMTNEHSRDVIQGKLVPIARAIQKVDLFRDCRSLLFYWLQIHIPALIVQPPTAVTRFSSHHIPRTNLDRRERSAARIFYGLLESASNRRDDRETPSKELRPRRSLTIPAGTTFSLQHKLLEELLKNEKVHESDQTQIVGTLSIKGTTHEFSLFDVRLLPENTLNEWRSSHLKDLVRANTELIVRMYLGRFPYEESENDKPHRPHV